MSHPQVTIGLDVGDRYCQVFGVIEEGEVIEEGRLPTTEWAWRRRFAGVDAVRIVLGVGTHSPWMSRLLRQLGHEVLVASLRAIYRRGEDKSDAIDAEPLVRWGRSDPRLLQPVQQHREETQVRPGQYARAISQWAHGRNGSTTCAAR